ncbi:CHAP domain-containing protein [Amycolatopsis suaedae]|uniref:CHAP domain-containing protein n=1 Tax=Amycolatopsis suaedae TaxID=2510978 RepID=A0A4Q7J3W2_9PSEU|nr:CHAP domain-containing protein [Amycolatopsis suaedae]RZQ62221.1 CHAP domain-containing protein [Amycolatopsis suaedae]
MSPRLLSAVGAVAVAALLGTATPVSAESELRDEFPALTAAADLAASRSEVVRIANGEVGYRERAGNCTKYSKDCAAWCGMFTRWVWNKAGVSKLPPAGYGKAWVATYWASWGAGKGLLKRRPAGTRKGDPAAGDVIVYGVPGSLAGHVAIVAKVHADGKLTTIDGNLSNKVVKRTIDPKTTTTNGGSVYGYVRPAF